MVPGSSKRMEKEGQQLRRESRANGRICSIIHYSCLTVDEKLREDARGPGSLRQEGMGFSGLDRFERQDSEGMQGWESILCHKLSYEGKAWDLMVGY